MLYNITDQDAEKSLSMKVDDEIDSVCMTSSSLVMSASLTECRLLLILIAGIAPFRTITNVHHLHLYRR